MANLFVNGLLGFITLSIYTPLEAHCIAHNNLHELPIDMTLYLPNSLIYRFSFSCFCIVISLSLRVK